MDWTVQESNPGGARFSTPVQNGHGVDHPPPLVPRLKKVWSYTSTPSLGLCGLFLG